MKVNIGCGALILTSHLQARHPLHDQFNKHKAVLLVQRGFGAPRFPGAWMVPTGVSNPNELPEQTLAREALEEFGVTFRPQDKPLHTGKKAGFTISYYLGTWAPIYDTPLLTCSPMGVVENIGLGFFTIAEAIALGDKHGFVFADALRKLA